MSTNNLLDRAMSDNMEDWPIFSYSQMQSWDRCEMLWHYAYARNWYRVRKEQHLNLGSEIHYALKYWYDLAILKVPKPERIREMYEYFARKVNEHAETLDMLPVVNKTMWLCMRYFQEFAPEEDKGHRIIEAEHHFTVPFRTGKGRNFILQGYIDLLTEYGDKLWTWDHKSMESTFWTPEQVQMEPQTPLYAAALREEGYKVHGNIINMFNTYQYKNPEKVALERFFCREKAYRTDVELNSTVQEMKFIVDDIIDEHPTPRRSRRLDCKSCSFREPCYMRIKGIDDEPLLRSEFVQKDKQEVELKLSPKGLMNAST